MTTKYRRSELVKGIWEEVKEMRATGRKEDARILESVRRNLMAMEEVKFDYHQMRGELFCPNEWHAENGRGRWAS